jgi:hypothetical protein
MWLTSVPASVVAGAPTRWVASQARSSRLTGLNLGLDRLSRRDRMIVARNDDILCREGPVDEIGRMVPGVGSTVQGHETKYSHPQPDLKQQ